MILVGAGDQRSEGGGCWTVEGAYGSGCDLNAAVLADVPGGAGVKPLSRRLDLRSKREATTRPMEAKTAQIVVTAMPAI